MIDLRISLLMVLTMYSLNVYSKINDYCSLCADHTMCIYQGIGPNCQNPGDGGISSKDKNEIVEVHNYYRSLVASGRENRGTNGQPQPPAASMLQMQWDNKLAEVAQRWADQCDFRHDNCRNDPRWDVGQNIYYSWNTHPVPSNWTQAISDWYKEVALFDPSIVRSYQFDKDTGHYTQMIWDSTHLIGCGRRNYGINKIYVCNYGPTGNWLNQPMYKIGKPCSKCPSGTHCTSNFLCASASQYTPILEPPEIPDNNPIIPENWLDNWLPNQMDNWHNNYWLQNHLNNWPNYWDTPALPNWMQTPYMSIYDNYPFNDDGNSRMLKSEVSNGKYDYGSEPDQSNLIATKSIIDQPSEYEDQLRLLPPASESVSEYENYNDDRSNVDPTSEYNYDATTDIPTTYYEESEEELLKRILHLQQMLKQLIHRLKRLQMQ